MKILGYPKHIKELDGIRGLACLFVLTHHCFTGVLAVEVTGWSKSIIDFFSIFFLSGVDLFFVLSGFLVGGIIIDNYNSQNFLKVFYLRRIFRIFPVYYLLIISFIIGYFLVGDYKFFDDSLFKHRYNIWSYVVFIQSYVFGLFNNSGPLWLAPSWSVSVEEQFYLLTPFLILLIGKKRALYFILLGIVIAPFIRFFLLNNVGFYAMYMFFPARMDTLFWGVLLAYFLRNESIRAKLRNFSLLIYMIILIILLSLYFKISISLVDKFTSLSLLYTCIMWVILEGESKKVKTFVSLRIFTYVGSISYAVYMFHQVINGLLHGFIFHSKPIISDLDTILVTCLSVLITVGISHFSLKYFENPIRKHGLKYKYEKYL